VEEIVETETPVFESANVEEIVETETPVFESDNVEEIVETETPVFESANVEEIVETETPVFESSTVEEVVETETPVFESPTVQEVVAVPTTTIQTELTTLPSIKTQSEEELIGQISEIGTSGNFASINTLTGYLQHPNPEVRYAVAATLGKLTASGRLSREVQQSIPILTRLSQDLDPRVRQEAIIALGKIPSHQVIPILQKALRDSQISVAQSASIALNKFKVYRVRPKSLPKSLMLKKPNISNNPE
ncbi:MAG TPA: HEAT repeat domain-containing protein, partial [Candidatus Obscuribacterales bacterium]